MFANIIIIVRKIKMKTDNLINLLYIIFSNYMIKVLQYIQKFILEFYLIKFKSHD